MENPATSAAAAAAAAVAKSAPPMSVHLSPAPPLSPSALVPTLSVGAADQASGTGATSAAPAPSAAAVAAGSATPAPSLPAAPAVAGPAAPARPKLRFDIGNNCEYEGEAIEIEVAKISSRETMDLLFKEVDSRIEYRYRLLEPLRYLRNPWHSSATSTAALPEAVRQTDTGSMRTVAHGRGVIRAKENGSVLYDGEWMYGYRNGYGDALIFRRDEAQGRPVFVGRYSGTFKAGLRDGRGTQHEVGGERYEGEWKYDQPNGTGTLHMLGGASWSGHWVDGRRHRTGRFVWASGAVDEREYEFDRLVASRPYTADDTGAALKRAEAEIEWLRNSIRTTHQPCMRCGTQPRDVVCLPCTHLVACAACLAGARACPACSAALTGSIKCLLR